MKSPLYVWSYPHTATISAAVLLTTIYSIAAFTIGTGTCCYLSFSRVFMSLQPGQTLQGKALQAVKPIHNFAKMTNHIVGVAPAKSECCLSADVHQTSLMSLIFFFSTVLF